MSIKKLFVWSLATIAAAVVTAVFLPGFLADSLYKNVEDINDGEMPPTIASFQSGPEVVSTIGGSGEGLNCSLPPWANVLFDGKADANGHRHLVLQRFRQACVFHDLCYRHGLATYGYNQNDCDRLLQNEAFRLCQYIRNGTEAESAARCQTDSKMVLAGVSIGGSDAYRAWNRSTYFEFDPDPWRSTGFRVSRVVDHPFKSVDPTKYRGDSDQIILMFENVRSNLTVTCITCKNFLIARSSRDVNDVSPELRSVGLKTLPEGLALKPPSGSRGDSDGSLQRDQASFDQIMSDTNPIWLPPRRHHAAPHLLVDSTGKNNLIWMSRNNPGDSITCIVVTDATKLMTYTLPRRDLCSIDAASQLDMVEVDMFSTTPLPVEIPELPLPYRIFATGFSAQKAADDSLSLSLCSRSASRPVDPDKLKHDDQARCHMFSDSRVSGGAGLGAFQNFAVVRPGEQIVFARDVVLKSDSWQTSVRQRVLGDTYSSRGNLLAIDLIAPGTYKEQLTARIRKVVPFDIDDRFDPMMPITKKKEDLRFLSLEKSNETVGVRMIDFSKGVPAPENVNLSVNGSNVDLHSSWALRPVLVLETKTADPMTKLVFSRGEIAGKPRKPTDPEPSSEALELEMLVFERRAAATPEEPFVKTGGAACTVTYTFRVNTDFPCSRAFDPKRPMRSSAAAKMQASQLLVGNFAGRDGQGIAFPDFCETSDPIILRPEGDTFMPATATTTTVGDEDYLRRTVTCGPLDSSQDLGKTIKHGKRPQAG